MSNGETKKDPKTITSNRAGDPSDKCAVIWRKEMFCPTTEAAVFSLWQLMPIQPSAQAHTHPLAPVHCSSAHRSTHSCFCVSSYASKFERQRSGSKCYRGVCVSADLQCGTAVAPHLWGPLPVWPVYAGQQRIRSLQIGQLRSHWLVG